MTVEEYFEEWWTPKELPEKGFNKTAMLDFAEMYHKKALRIHDFVVRSEQLKAFLLFIQENAPNYRTKQLKPEQVIKAYIESI